MKYCEDCGTRVYNGICSNCEEELAIEDCQGEFIESRSPEWVSKVGEQIPKQLERLRKSGNK